VQILRAAKWRKIVVADMIALHQTLINTHQLQVHFSTFSPIVTNKMPWSCIFHKDQQFVGRKQSLHHSQVKYDIVLEFIQKYTPPQNSETKQQQQQQQQQQKISFEKITVLQSYLCPPWSTCCFLGRNNRVDRQFWIQNDNMLYNSKSTQHLPVEKLRKVKH